VDNGEAPSKGQNLSGGDGPMLTGEWVRDFAQEWVRSWNAHDLDAILGHYADGVVLTSPVAARLLGDPSGNVRGKAALRSYFSKGLEAYPNLKFELKDVMWGLSSVVLYYTNQVGKKSGEFMEIDANGKVVRVVANYGD
jgi:ketosteroid isomerase-like protein